MKDGRISCQGTPDEIAKADPLIMSESEKAIREVTESEVEQSGTESETVLEERKALNKQISRQVGMPRDGTARKSGAEKKNIVTFRDSCSNRVSHPELH